MKDEKLASSIETLDAIVTRLQIRLNVLELQLNLESKPSWISGIWYSLIRLFAITVASYLVWCILDAMKVRKIRRAKKKNTDLLNSALVLSKENVLNIRPVFSTWNSNFASYKPFTLKFGMSDHISFSKKDMYVIVSLIQINMTHDDILSNTDDADELRRICNAHHTKKIKNNSNDLNIIAKLGAKYGLIYPYQNESAILPSTKKLKACNHIDIPNASQLSLVLLTIVNVTVKNQKRLLGQCIIPSKLVFSHIERSNTIGSKINELLTPTRRASKDNLSQLPSPKNAFSPEAIAATESVANSIKARQAKLKEQEEEQHIASKEAKIGGKTSGEFSISSPLECACIPYLGMSRNDHIEKDISGVTIYLSFARHSFHWITDSSSNIEVDSAAATEDTDKSHAITSTNTPSRHYIRTKSKHIFNCPAFGSQLKYLFASGPIHITTTLEVNAWIDGYLYATKLSDNENVFVAVNCSIGFCQPIVAGNNEVSNFAKSKIHLIKTSNVIGFFYFMFQADNDEYSDYDFAIEIQYLDDFNIDHVKRFVIYPTTELIWKQWIRLFALCSNLTKSVEIHVNDNIIEGPHKLVMPHLLNYLPLVSLTRPLMVVCVSRLPVTILQCVSVDDFFHPGFNAQEIILKKEELNSDDLIPRFVDMYNQLDMDEIEFDQFDINSTSNTPKSVQYPKESRDAESDGWSSFVKSIGSIFG